MSLPVGESVNPGGKFEAVQAERVTGASPRGASLSSSIWYAIQLKSIMSYSPALYMLYSRALF